MSPSLKPFKKWTHVFLIFVATTLHSTADMSAYAATEAPLLPESASILEQFPALKKELFHEPPNGLYFGLGLSPIQLLNSRLGMSISFFQLHTIKRYLDWEIFNASFGSTRSTADSTTNSNVFQFRTAPKFRIFDNFSFGPLGGMEFMSFPGISARLTRDRFFAPYEPFSKKGIFYGAVASQLIEIGNGVFFRINEMIYKQQYNVTNAGEGWKYEFQRTALQTETGRAPLQPATVFAVDFSILF